MSKPPLPDTSLLTYGDQNMIVHSDVRSRPAPRRRTCDPPIPVCRAPVSAGPTLSHVRRYVIVSALSLFSACSRVVL